MHSGTSGRTGRVRDVSGAAVRARCAFPEGVDENVEFPGGTWRVVLVMPVDLSITEGHVDPLLFLVALADGAAEVEDKVQDLVTHCRHSGKTWTQRGQALGTTRQSAWERFSGKD